MKNIGSDNLVEENPQDGSIPGLIDIFDQTKLVGDKNIAQVFAASRSTGHSIASLIQVISNIDKLPNKKDAFPKALTLLGGVLGEFLSGVDTANEEIKLKTELPSERNTRLKSQITELKAMKETNALEEELATLLKETQSKTKNKSKKDTKKKTK